MKVKDGAISRKQAVKALIGWDEEAKDEDIIFTLNELPNVVPKKDTEPTIPLSVIEDIKAEINTMRNRNITLFKADGLTKQELTFSDSAYVEVLETIDKAVREVEK